VTTEELVIVGGSDAGAMAALWAKDREPHLPVTLVVRDAYPNFSICGIPFYLSGETPEWPMLAHRTSDDLEELGLSTRPAGFTTSCSTGTSERY
jgi:NADPH-dependent 2,4-dienoyl-CoA reductase/sulfur reductase-like enzyme